METTSVQGTSATRASGEYDAIVTDPPYYDAIPYSDLMDFFYVWLRRSIPGLSAEIESVFSDALGPKWDHDADDGELIDDASRFDGDRERSKQNYEDGMARSFRSCHAALRPDGRLVVVFANKQPDAWETLVAALIRAGFVVDGSWPIQTEMGTRTRAMASAALVLLRLDRLQEAPRCPPRLGQHRPQRNAREHRPAAPRLLGRGHSRAGLRVGRDRSGPGSLQQASRGQEGERPEPVHDRLGVPARGAADGRRFRRRPRADSRTAWLAGGQEAATGLDDVTTYYLLHRHDFGMGEAPIGGCILYALSCNLSDSALVNQHDLLAQSGKGGRRRRGLTMRTTADDVDETSGGGGARVKLKPWDRRRGRNLGLEAPGGRPVPLIDQVHKLMHLWRAGDQVKVDDYLDTRGLQRNVLFNQILQALIELAGAGSDERALLEALSNHAAARGDVQAPRQKRLQLGSPEL